MGKTPFKMKGFSGFGNSPMTKKSPAKDDPHTTTEDHAVHEVETKTETEGPDPFIQSLLDKVKSDGYKSLSEQEKKILGKYKARKPIQQ